LGGLVVRIVIQPIMVAIHGTLPSGHVPSNPLGRDLEA
jgi:hypothetical protein